MQADLIMTRTTEQQLAPVITIDGPSGTGKGTVSLLLANKLHWHYLDSGFLFRVIAYAALEQNVSIEDEIQLVVFAKTLDIQHLEGKAGPTTLLNNQDVTNAIRSEPCGNAASKIGVFPAVRQYILEKQREFRIWPGLVTDGRDMGTVIFPDAQYKFFLQASAGERAKRRFNQLKKKGIPASIDQILQDLIQRDTRDKERGVAPLRPAPDAILIDTTELTVQQVLDRIIEEISMTK